MLPFDKKYKKLKLSSECLRDPFLVAMAWKKAQQYIRTSNWYADSFELDLSALDLESKVGDWAKIISNENPFQPLELVPAPKGQGWEFVPRNWDDFLKGNLNQNLENDLWKPKWIGVEEKLPIESENKKRDEEVKLRPLAHIAIAEQTITTLLMMCLADEVETKQGNPSTVFENVHGQKVSSYGNRLYCRYDDKGEATHSWGATTAYGKYFEDYRQFLARPIHFASEERSSLGSDESVYIVDLDLSKFFDLVNREELKSKIRELDSYSADAAVESLLSKFCDWAWSDEAKQGYRELFYTLNDKGDKVEKEAPAGLPQGLVASGFFANLYMLGFDSSARELIGGKLGDNSEYRVLDYCRYVDDMRVVIVGPRNTEAKVKAAVEKQFELLLNQLGLELNKEKTKVEVFVGRKQGISTIISDIQSKLSGPISASEIDDQLGHLESLLVLSESMSAQGNSNHSNALANIESSTLDVRDDTLKRFTANKISKLLASKRHITTQEMNDDGVAIAGQWDYLQERMARKFIACWSKDPSLVLLLKKGLELYPDPWLLKPVLANLTEVINRKGKQGAVAEYCLSEIYRHAATVIHKKNRWALPAHADVEVFFELLQESAANHLGGKASTKFNLIEKQASLLLLVREDTLLCKTQMGPEEDLIAALVKGMRCFANTAVSPKQVACCILLANQVKPDTKSTIRSCSLLINAICAERPANLEPIVVLITKGSSDLFTALVRHARAVKHEWVKRDVVQDVIRAVYSDLPPAIGKLSNYADKSIALISLIKRADNPFANETASLVLFQSIIKYLLSDAGHEDRNSLGNGQYLDVGKTKVSVSGLSEIPHHNLFGKPPSVVTLGLAVDDHGLYDHSLFKHVEAEMVLRRLGQFLRGCIVGSSDWTASFNQWDVIAGYKGVKSTALKRSFGLAHEPEILGGPTSSVSGWIAGLLTRLLQWPGISIGDDSFQWPKVWDLETLKDIVDERVEVLKGGYLKSSGIPSVQEAISLDWKKEKTDLKVVMVQSMFPSQKDFETYGFKLDAPKCRTTHRKHIAAVSELIVHHVFSQRVANGYDGKKKCDIDLIVWPEIAVHEDDLDVLKDLSRKTKSIVYAGLTFIDQQGVKGPNNCAVWIVPRKKGLFQKEIIRYQGKANMTGLEEGKVVPWRPYQLLLELKHPKYPTEKGFVLTGSICYDATDISLSADLRDKSSAFLVAAYNKDITTFDSMIDALHYHMYQHVVLVNTGVYGGSAAKAPYKEPHKRLIAHVHGNNQVSLSTFEMNMFDFRRDDIGKGMKSDLVVKTKPAGIK